MAYDDKPTRYEFGVHDFGAGAEIFYVTGPKGKRGMLVDYGVDHVTEAFNAVTTPATVSIGTAADPDAYGEEFSLGTTALDAGSKSVLQTYQRGSEDYQDFVLPGKWIAADVKVGLHCVAPTGGTPTGIAQPFMEIIWEK
jgi:hypothetical protein